MFKLIKLITTGTVCALFASGCAVQQKYWGQVSPVFMNETARPLIGSSRIVVGLDQDTRMGAPVVANGNSGRDFGIIGALIESAIVHSENDSIQARQRMLTGVNGAVINYNIGSKFREAAETKLRPLDWLKVKYVVKKHSIKIPEVEQMVKTLEEDVLMLIDNKYIMAEDFSKISVLSYVALYAGEKNLAKIAVDARPYENPPTLYKNLFQYEYPYEGGLTTANDALSGWSANEGEMITRALDASIENLTNQIITDLSYTTVGFRD